MFRRFLSLIILCLCLIPLVALATPFEYETCNLGWQHVHHKHNEESYQRAWCNMHGGVMEYENPDKTRVDCLTKTHAVEFDLLKFSFKLYKVIPLSLVTLITSKICVIERAILDSSGTIKTSPDFMESIKAPKSIDELRKQYDDIVDDITRYLTNKVEGVSEHTRGEVLRKLETKKDDIARNIANLSENSKDTTKRISLLIDFANRIPELYLKATLDEKRLILNTITENIIYDEENNTLRVKLRPAFEHLRQIKLQKKQEFSTDVKNLIGTLETRSEKAKQALKNERSDVNQIKVYGTRKRLMNTKKEPTHRGSKKFNVVKVTTLEPNNKDIASDKEPVSNNMYAKLIHIMKESTFEYYNMRMSLGLECS